MRAQLTLRRLLPHQGVHLCEEQNDRRPQRDQDHGREDQEEDRKDELDADLAGALLSVLAEARPNILPMRAQSRSQAGAELVRIEQQTGEFLELDVAAAGGEIVQRLHPRWIIAKLKMKLG